MARESNAPEKTLFVGETKRLYFPITNRDNVTPENVLGWGLIFEVRKTDTSGTVLLHKASANAGEINVVGDFDADPEINTQEVEVVLNKVDTEILKPFTYRYALRRIDPGFEAVLAFGDLPVAQAAAR